MLNHPNDRVGAEVLSFLSIFMFDGNKVVQVILFNFTYIVTVQYHFLLRRHGRATHLRMSFVTPIRVSQMEDYVLNIVTVTM